MFSWSVSQCRESGAGRGAVPGDPTTFICSSRPSNSLRPHHDDPARLEPGLHSSKHIRTAFHWGVLCRTGAAVSRKFRGTTGDGNWGTACFADHDTPLTLHGPAHHARTRAVQWRRCYARTCRPSSIPSTSRSLPTFSGGGSWTEPLLKTAHQRIPTEGVSTGGFAFWIPASSACARPLLIPGTCDLTRRRTDASDSAAHCAWTGPDIPAP